MKDNEVKTENRHIECLSVLFLLFLGIAIRVYQFGLLPGGINQDEAYAGYEAWALLNHGMDSHGYSNPVYLVAWGSGMNALGTYMMMPWIALFGLNAITVRLPQLIMSCLCLPVLYHLLKKMADTGTALLGLLLLAVNPWHIMLSRWGLESNLLPAFLLLGCVFMTLAAEKEKYLYLSAIAYGFSLYAYATIWLVLPFMIALELVYLRFCGKIRWMSKPVLGFVCILALFALPLILFLMIQFGWIGEIRNAVLSIPKLPGFRQDELGIADWSARIKALLDLLIRQNDGIVHNSPSSLRYGQFYFYGLPFAAAGLISLLVRSARSFKARRFEPGVLLMIWFCSAAILGLSIQDVNVNRINSLYIPLIVLIALGMEEVLRRLRYPWIRLMAACMILICFSGFVHYYFTYYPNRISYEFDEGLDEALAFAQEIQEGTEKQIVCDVSYSKILFYTQMPPDVFCETVKWENYPDNFLRPLSCQGFRFGAGGQWVENEDRIVVMRSGILLEQGGCPETRKEKQFGTVSVVY